MGSHPWPGWWGSGHTLCTASWFTVTSVFSLASPLLLDCFQEGSTIFRVTAQNSVGDRIPLIQSNLSSSPRRKVKVSVTLFTQIYLCLLCVSKRASTAFRGRNMHCLKVMLNLLSWCRWRTKPFSEDMTAPWAVPNRGCQLHWYKRHGYSCQHP